MGLPANARRQGRVCWNGRGVTPERALYFESGFWNGLAVGLVLGVALVLLTGCATPDVQCQMRADYQLFAPIAPEGEVLIKWAYNSTPKRSDAYGDTECWDAQGQRVCIIRLKGPPPTFNDPCGLARLGHETGHALHARHD